MEIVKNIKNYREFRCLPCPMGTISELILIHSVFKLDQFCRVSDSVRGILQLNMIVRFKCFFVKRSGPNTFTCRHRPAHSFPFPVSWPKLQRRKKDLSVPLTFAPFHLVAVATHCPSPSMPLVPLHWSLVQFSF